MSITTPHLLSPCLIPTPTPSPFYTHTIHLCCAPAETRSLTHQHKQAGHSTRRTSASAASSVYTFSAALLVRIVAFASLPLACAIQCSWSSGLPCDRCECNFFLVNISTLYKTGSCPDCSEYDLVLSNQGIKTLSQGVFENIGSIR